MFVDHTSFIWTFPKATFYDKLNIRPRPPTKRRNELESKGSKVLGRRKIKNVADKVLETLVVAHIVIDPLLRAHSTYNNNPT